MNLKKAFDSVRKYLGSSVGAMSLSGWSYPGNSWSKGDLINQNSRYVYSIVAAIAQEAAKIDLVMTKTVQLKLGEKKVEVPNHEFLKMLKKPNADTSQFQFLEFHFTYMKVMGESYWYVLRGEASKKPKELYLLPPQYMKVNTDKEDPRGLVKDYTLKGLNGADDTELEKNEITHFKMPNLANPYYGMSPIAAGKLFIETEKYASEWTKNALYNSGRPSGIINIRSKIGEEQFKIMKQQFKEQYSGTKNAGKTMLVQGAEGLDYAKLGMELSELALGDLKNMTRDDIMLMFRVSKTILGISTDVNLANAKEARAVFALNVVMPEMDRFIDNLNVFVKQEYGDEFELTYNRQNLISDADKLEQKNLGVYKWYTPNEIRAEEGLDPLDGGDQLYIPINMIPLNSDSGSGSGTDPNAPAGKKKEIKKKDKNHDRIEVFRTTFYRNQAIWERQYKKKLVSEFARQEAEVLAKHPNAKSITIKVLDDWIFDVSTSQQRLIGELLPLVIELMQQQGDLAMGMTRDDKTQFLVNDRIKKTIQARLELIIGSVNDNTLNQLRDSLTQGITAGEALGDLTKRVESVFTTATHERATLIARTETIAASNAAAQEAYQQSPQVVYKIWQAEGDACEFCAPLDGTIIGLNETFFEKGQEVQGANGGVYPVDYDTIEYPPLHPNCRCAIVPAYEQ